MCNWFSSRKQEQPMGQHDIHQMEVEFCEKACGKKLALNLSTKWMRNMNAMTFSGIYVKLLQRSCNNRSIFHLWHYISLLRLWTKIDSRPFHYAVPFLFWVVSCKTDDTAEPHECTEDFIIFKINTFFSPKAKKKCLWNLPSMKKLLARKMVSIFWRFATALF